MPEATETGWGAWHRRIAAARRRVEDLAGTWQQNVDARRGKSTETAPGTTVLVNQDWPLTKAKIAQLFSRTPEVRLTPRFPQLAQAVPIFAKELNVVITETATGNIIEEVLADAINASGIGAVLVTCERRTETRSVPLIDPTLAVMGQAIPTADVPVPVDIQYRVQRISPTDLLVPSDFTGSVYDQARWLGEQGRMTWAQAVHELGLTEDQKERVLGTDRRAGGSTRSLSSDTTKFQDVDVVNYVQVFYWRHFFHAEETRFKALHRLVFVDGLDEPVINEEYAGQQRTETDLLGVVRNPIRVLTLTYISDDALPPSDSAISRPTMDELARSRDAIVQQRAHSIPIRWFDTSRVSPATKSLLEQGGFQGFIPTNGPGDRAIGEVARANFPQERFEFDRVIKTDLTEQWQVGTNQAGAFASGERSASEARIVQQNFQTRIGQERDKVSAFFLGIVEVLAGHLSLYGTFDLPDQIGVAREALATGMTYSVRVDSTVRLDAQQRIEQLKEALNLTAQSGFVNPKPVIEEIWALSGMDPSVVVVDPQPKTPDPVKVSVSKAEDLMNPLFVALLMRTHQAPAPPDVAAAKALLQQLGMPIIPMLPAPQGSETPSEIERPGITHADWESAPRIDRRDNDGGLS